MAGDAGGVERRIDAKQRPGHIGQALVLDIGECLEVGALDLDAD